MRRRSSPGTRERSRLATSPILSRTAAQGSPDYSKATVDHHIDTLPNGVILKALNVFINTFPELAILHLPTFIQEFQSERSPAGKTLLGAVLAVTKAQLSAQGTPWEHELLERENYALYSKDMLGESILQPPKLQVVQALLVITLYEWGTRNFHKAWVYCGTSAIPLK